MRTLGLFSLVVALSAQSSFSFLTGKITGISGDQVTVQEGSTTSVLLFVDKESKISSARAGDEVTIQYRRASSGHLMIVELYARIEHIWGRITKVGPKEFEVEENFNADPQSAYRRGYRSIAFDSTTQFEGSVSEDLRIGRTVDVLGVNLKNDSRVKASRIIIYEGNAPARMPAGARVVQANGAVLNPTHR